MIAVQSTFEVFMDGITKPTYCFIENDGISKKIFKIENIGNEFDPVFFLQVFEEGNTIDNDNGKHFRTVQLNIDITNPLFQYFAFLANNVGIVESNNSKTNKNLEEGNNHLFIGFADEEKNKIIIKANKDNSVDPNNPLINVTLGGEHNSIWYFTEFLEFYQSLNDSRVIGIEEPEMKKILSYAS